MADTKSPANPLFLREEEIRHGIELLFYAYRAFTAEPDAILAELGLGRAHHRALYFIGRNPQMTVSALLGILRITKQSLGRVLSDLIARDYVVQRPGEQDRRQRLLALTETGEALERRLFESQRRLVAGAYRRAGAEAVDGCVKVLRGLVEGGDGAAEEAGASTGTTPSGAEAPPPDRAPARAPARPRDGAPSRAASRRRAGG